MDDPDKVFRYFKEHVERGFRHIFDEQRSVAAAKAVSLGRSRSEALQKALSSPPLTVTGSGSSLAAVARYPTFVRFLDMRRFENLRVYNRPIWGILYRQTIPDIRYEFADWLRANVGESLSEAFKG